MRETAMKNLESTQNELQNSKEKCGQLELLEHNVNNDIQIRLTGIENKMEQQASNEKAVSTQMHLHNLSADCGDLLDIEDSNRNLSLPTRTIDSSQDKEKCLRDKDYKQNVVLTEDNENTTESESCNREQDVSVEHSHNNIDQLAYSERIAELEFIILSKEDESNQAITDLITELDKVKAMRETAMKNLESTQNELQNSKEKCGQLELLEHNVNNDIQIR